MGKLNDDLAANHHQIKAKTPKKD